MIAATCTCPCCTCNYTNHKDQRWAMSWVSENVHVLRLFRYYWHIINFFCLYQTLYLRIILELCLSFPGRVWRSLLLKQTRRKMTLTLSLPNVSKGKFRPNFQISFCKILTNNVQVQAESCHLNGHIVGFGPQTQKLESPYKTPSNTLAVKGLRGME